MFHRDAIEADSMHVSDIANERRLKIIQSCISSMPSLSTTATKVIETCNNPAVSPNDLKQVISLDPVLTGQVLKLINSAYYSLVNEVTSLTRAIIMLGINTIKNLVLSLSVMKNIKNEDTFQAFTIDEFWAHSICVGVTAKLIATATNVPVLEREEFFLAGLLHDLGKIPLNICFPHDYFSTMNLVKKARLPLYDVEQKILGISHCVVGGMIAEKWALRGNLSDALNYHHTPDHKDISGNRKFLGIITLADLYAHMMNIQDWDDIADLEKLTSRVGIDIDTLKSLRQPVTGEIEKAKIFLQLTYGG